MEYAQIGQVVVVDDEFNIESDTTDDVIRLEKGDRGIVDSEGYVRYITGNARGKKQPVYDLDHLVGYDVVSMTDIVLANIEDELEVSIEDLLGDSEKEGALTLAIANAIGFVLQS